MSVEGCPCPGSPRETLLDVALRRKEVLVAKGVVEEVRKKVGWFRGDSKGGKEKVDIEKDAKMEEKARAAAWAWYQHGNGGKECISTGGKSGTFVVRARRSLHKSSRFKTEVPKSFNIDGPCGENPVQKWDCSTGWSPTTSFFDTSSSSTPRSSLFDSYELDIVSKRIDSAFQVEVIAPALAWVLPPPSKLGKSSSLRFQIPENKSRSLGDILYGEEMATGIGIRKCDCNKNKAKRRGGWSFRRSSRALQVLLHPPNCEQHPQLQQRLKRFEAGEQCQEHKHDHEHEHHEQEYHHHVHYQVRLRDGMSYSKASHKVSRNL